MNKKVILKRMKISLLNWIYAKFVVQLVVAFSYFRILGLRRTNSLVRFGLLHVLTISLVSMPVVFGKEASHI